MNSLLPDFSALKIRTAHLQLYAALRWVLIPLCWPTQDGKCGCRCSHYAKDVGKAPLVGLRAAEDGLLTPTFLSNRLTSNTAQNMGVLLKPSGLLVIDCDSSEAVQEVLSRGLPPCPVVARAERRHYYLARPAGFSGRAIRTGTSRAIDVLANGYTVVPPSRHRSGHGYEWLTPPTDVLPLAPGWALDALRNGARPRSVVNIPASVQPLDIQHARVSPRIRQLVQLGPEAEPGRYRSRSEALFACVLALVEARHDDEQIAGLLLNPQHAIAEKPIEKGLAWLAGEIGRARQHIMTPGGRRQTIGTIRIEVGR